MGLLMLSKAMLPRLIIHPRRTRVDMIQHRYGFGIRTWYGKKFLDTLTIVRSGRCDVDNGGGGGELGKKSHKMGREWKRKKGGSKEEKGRRKLLKIWKEKYSQHLLCFHFICTGCWFAFIGGCGIVVMMAFKSGFANLRRGPLFWFIWTLCKWGDCSAGREMRKIGFHNDIYFETKSLYFDFNYLCQQVT